MAEPESDHREYKYGYFLLKTAIVDPGNVRYGFSILITSKTTQHISKSAKPFLNSSQHKL